MNQKTIITILVVVVVVLLGTTVYFATINSQPIVSTQKAVQQQTSTTQSVINQPVKTDTKATSDWKIYKNDKYGFELTFPDTWRGYTTANRTLDWGNLGTSDSIDFGLPTQKDGLFNISIHSKQQWKDIQNEDGPKPEFLGENGNYVFAWARAQYATDNNIEKRMEEVKSIIKTFNLTK